MKTTAEDIRCVWMTSKVIDYKLCDNRFECEECEFDKVMRSGTNLHKQVLQNADKDLETDIIDGVLNNLMLENHHEHSIYLPNNLVLDELADQTFRLSLSSFAVHFLDNVFAMIPGRKGGKIRKGQSCLMLSGPWGGITVNAPIHFLYLDKSDDTVNHEKARWVIGIIQSEKNEIARVCISPQEWQQQVIELSRKLIQYKLQFPEMDRTATDGGQKFQYLYQRIGTERYLDILNFLFRQKIKTRGV